MISTKGLKYTFNSKKTINYPDFEVGQGEHCLILGGSGCGKTTLLHLLAGLLKIQTGDLMVADQKINQFKSHQMDRFRGQNIGLVFQRPHLIDELSVKDNLKLAQYLAEEKQDDGRINEVLQELQIGDKLKSRIFELSQGELQRVSLARAVINRPKVLLADEPTASLDDINSQKVIQLLVNEAEKYSATLIIATHDQRVKDRFSKQLNLMSS